MNKACHLTVISLMGFLPYICMSDEYEVHSVYVKPGDKKIVAIPVYGPYIGDLDIHPESGKLIHSGIKIQDRDLWFSVFKRADLHKYRVMNAYSGQEFVSITGIVTTAGPGGGKGKIPPFQVTVPEIDVDWIEYDDWEEENGEDTRLVYLPNDVRKEFVVREPREKDDGMLPMPDRLPDLELTWPQGVLVYTNDVLVASPMRIKSKEWTQKGNSWPIHLFAAQNMSMDLPPGPLAIRLERMPTKWDVNGEITFDEIKATVIKVSLLVNNTEAETDDYVIKEKPSVTRITPRNTPAGATDNHIPMKVRLHGPAGFSCKVLLSSVGGGSMAIKKTDGTTYPAVGETVSVGTDLDLHLFGTSASVALNDVTIEARTDKTDAAICGQEDLTVVWIPVADMSYRGSAHQNDPFTSASEAQGSPEQPQKCGLQVGKVSETVKTQVKNREEIKITVSPDAVIPSVSWKIERDVSSAVWYGNPPDPEPVALWGATDWEQDGTATHGLDVDLVQQPTCKYLFTNDSPGGKNLACVTGARYTYKGKFQEWVEIQIGGKWYVCSPYKYWHSILYAKHLDFEVGWGKDTSKTSQILEGDGGLAGFSGNWNE